MATTEPQIHQPGTDDGWHGVIKTDSNHPPEQGRYHLYIGLFCPFAHRVNLVRHLKGLTDIIPISVTLPKEKPFIFAESDDEYPGSTTDRVLKSKGMKDIYLKSDPEYKGRFSVAALLDTATGLLVNNESAEMLHWLPNAFDDLVPEKLRSFNLYPSKHRATIDTITP
jgi:glutathionyl-hydroquinone reductase